MSTRHLESSRTFPVSVEHAHDTVVSTPLPDIFHHRYLAIPPISSVEGQEGRWGTSVGQTRTIRLADGGAMVETLTAVDRPHHFDYALSDFTGPLKPLVASVTGRWAFEPAGTGSRITWTWDVIPTERIGRLSMPVFAKLWSGYARHALDTLETIVLA